jgi:hypothetical protein
VGWASAGFKQDARPASASAVVEISEESMGRANQDGWPDGMTPESEQLKFPQWQKPLQEALIELDQNQLRQRVAAAEAAIAQRMQTVPLEAIAERQALADAQSSLRILKRDHFQFPD